MLKILHARLQQYMNWEFPDVQAGFRKGRGTRDQIANICRIIEKAWEFQKNIYFSFQFSSVWSLSHVQFAAIPWIAVHRASLSITNPWSLLKLMSIELVMPSNHLILCHPLLLPPSIFPSIRVFSNESEVGVFLKLSCFFYDPTDVGNLISGSSAFSKSSLNIWKFSVHLLLKPHLENFSITLLACEVSAVVQ